MIIVDAALEKREAGGTPIRVGLVGGGYMGRGIALQFLTPLVGMRLVAIANRTLSKAEAVCRQGGIDSPRVVDSVKELEATISTGQFAIAEDPELICRAGGIDAIVEATGQVEFGANVVLKALESGKHIILSNAELDATIGPILKVHADRAGVVITNTDGDEPGVAMNLYRFVKSIGHRPVMAGNFKGMLDPYRTPVTQRSFAEKYDQKSMMVTSFADGTKLSMEAAILANATGFKVAQRGMIGHHCAHVRDTLKFFSPEQFTKGGLVDYILGAEPHTGAFVLSYEEHPIKRQYMDYFKMGEGPIYVFYTPYHLPHLQLANTVARAVLFRDATVAPSGPPMCDVLTAAKRDLRKGETLDGIGGFTCYGVIDNAEVCRREAFLPMGLSQDCILKRHITRDEIIYSADVERPPRRVCDQLRHEQDLYFSPC